MLREEAQKQHDEAQLKLVGFEAFFLTLEIFTFHGILEPSFLRDKIMMYDLKH